jgi:hypothetical protein
MHSLSWESLLFILIFPPVGAILWWLMSKGWAATIQGGTISASTRKRQQILFWVLMAAAYVVEFVGVMAHRLK